VLDARRFAFGLLVAAALGTAVADEVSARAVHRNDHVRIQRLQLRHGLLQIVIRRNGEMEAADECMQLSSGGLHSWRDRSSADDSLRKARWMEDVMFGRATIGGSFTLTDTSGQRRSLSEFRGRIVLLYFGYTYCPDVCPTDLLQIADVLERLGPQADQVQALFVTFDRSGTLRKTCTAISRTSIHARSASLVHPPRSRVLPNPGASIMERCRWEMGIISSTIAPTRS
jgi:hypothetical protein